MKGKIPKILSLALALALVLSFSLVAAVPAMAGTLSPVTATSPSSAPGVTTTYTIGFGTATTYEVDTVDMEFDTGFGVSSAALVGTATGIGAGTVSVSGQTVTYTVDTLAVIDASTPIAIALSGIVNPATAGSYDVIVTTKSSTGAIVDTGTATVAITSPAEVWVDAAVRPDGTVLTCSNVANSVLIATEDIFTAADEGAAVEFLTGDADPRFTTITGVSDSKTVTLADNVGEADEGDIFNLLDLTRALAGDRFRYIQCAVNTVAADTIVNVAAGTYAIPSTLNITTAGLTLRGANYGVNPVTETRGAESTITIDVSGSTVNYAIKIHGTGLTVDGFTIDGSKSTTAILLEYTADRAAIQNNIITDTTNVAISLSADSIGDCTTGVTISGNLIGNSGVGVMLQKGANDNNISNNKITGSRWTFDGAISLCGAGTSNNTITHNTLVNNAGAGVWLFDNTGGGCGDVGSGNDINYNNIYGNTSYGIFSGAGNPTIDAENNWWGDASGPYATTTNTSGTGDTVSGPVDYRPWLSESYPPAEPPTPVTTIDLVAGWNLISLPLIPTSSTITDVLADISSSVTIVQYYSAEVQDWLYYYPGVAESTLSTMEDGLGYWINMSAAATLDVSSGTPMPAPPALPHTYSVFEDWNLVGFKSTTPMSCTLYLANLGIAPTGYTVLYGYDAVEGYFSVYPMLEHSGNMEPGCGYWLWATADGTIVPPR